MENKENQRKVSISAGAVVQDYVIKLPPQNGNAGELLSTDGLGNTSWLATGTGVIFLTRGERSLSEL